MKDLKPELTLKITWLNNGFIQYRKLINYCTSDHKKQTYITMNSPIYEAIENGTFVLDMGSFGKHPFKIEESWRTYL